VTWRLAIPFAAYALVVAGHLVLVWRGRPARAVRVTKWLLIPALLVAVLVAVWCDRAGAHRSAAAIAVLCVAILASWAGDVLISSSFVAGLATFAAAHVAYIVVFLGLARSRSVPWPALLLVVWLTVLVVVLRRHLDSKLPAVVGYGMLLGAMAATAWGVSDTTGWGGAAFLASDTVLVLQLFRPDFRRRVPQRWGDLAIMTLYCVGQGTIALGVVGRA